MGCKGTSGSCAVKQWLRSFLLLVALAAAMTSPLQAQTTAVTTTVAIGGPGNGMLQAGDGNFYSPSTPFFVACGDDPTQLCAYIYKMTPKGVASIFYSFQRLPASGGAGILTINKDGLWPVALFVGADGALYGACRYDGPLGAGTIFRIALDGTLTVLKSFKAGDPGYVPLALIQGADGNFYFTNGIGIYRLTGDGTVSAVYEYPIDPVKLTSPMGNSADSIVQGSDGDLYITQSVGPQTTQADPHTGAILRLTLNGQPTILHAFAADGSEGDGPGGPLVQGSDGGFYGVTRFSGNSQNPGVAFRVDAGHGFMVLQKFNGTDEGNRPTPGLIVGSDGNLYGTTLIGGDTTSDNCKPAGCGTLFQLTPSGTLTTLHTFKGGTPTSTVVADNPQVDGEGPGAPLVQTNGGLFYGTAVPTVFQSSLTPALLSPIAMTFDPPQVVTGKQTTLTWKVNNAFSLTAQQCVASIVGNPPGAGTWSGLQAGKLTNGIYSGSAAIAPTVAGTYVYALTCGGRESQFAALVVAGDSPIQITTLGLPNGTVTQPYTALLSATGGKPPYSWVAGGAQPKGINFDTGSGLLSGTPLQYGDYSLTFSVQDSDTPPQQQSASYPLTIESGLTLFPGLPNPVVGKQYSQAMIVNGGIKPYTFVLVSGTIPAGLQFNTNSGLLSGTPTDVNQYTFTIKVSDSENPKATDTKTYTLSTSPAALSITTDAILPGAKVGVPYLTSFSASGGTPPYMWGFGTITPPTFMPPPGLFLSSAGTLAGTPIQYLPTGQTYNFNITLTDSATPPAMVTGIFGLAVASTLQITNSSLPTGTVGTLTTIPLTATGGIPPYNWSASSSPRPADIGIYLEGDSLVYDPLIATTGSVTLVVTDSETKPKTETLTFPLTFLAAPLLTTTTLTSSNSTAGTGESITLTATVAVAGGATPIGQVIFYNGTASIGTATLGANGVATLKTSFSANGVYNITAAYGGNASYAASTSAPLTETIVTPTISTSVSPGSLTIQSGKSGQLLITLTPNDGYSGTINFSCGTLPAHVSCTFAPPSLTIAAGSGPVTDTLTVSTSAPTVAMLEKPFNRGPSGGFLAAAAFWFPGPLAVVLGLVRRKRRPATRRIRNFGMLALLCFAAMSIFTSCGGGFTNNAQPGTYTVPITLTLGGGATQSVNATVIVK